jgi:hypothetical protein
MNSVTQWRHEAGKCAHGPALFVVDVETGNNQSGNALKDDNLFDQIKQHMTINSNAHFNLNLHVHDLLALRPIVLALYRSWVRTANSTDALEHLLC